MTKILETADDVTPDVEKWITFCVDWFDSEPTMGVQEFIDRFCETYGDGQFDIESYDNPAVRKIMRLAREDRRERQ